MNQKEKFARYYKRKTYSSKRRGINFLLTKKDVANLLDEAGITIWDVGIGRDKYCLGRKDDRGDYSLGNCRFITNEENQSEWWKNVDPDEHRQKQIDRWNVLSSEKKEQIREAGRNHGWKGRGNWPGSPSRRIRGLDE